MKNEEMKIISEHLIDAILKEDITQREAAKALNLSPCYISMAKNPKSWNSMPKDAWYRLTHWHNSRGKITKFKIPEDELIWEPKEKIYNTISQQAAKKPEPAKEKPEVQESRNPKKEPQKIRIIPGIRDELIKELQTRKTQLTNELEGIAILLNSYYE